MKRHRHSSLPRHSSSNKIIHTKAPSTASTKFDFYTLLPKMEVVVANPLQANNLSTGTNLKDIANDKKTLYFLQLASLHSKKDALDFKHELTQYGYLSSIQRFQDSQGQIWYRVLIGPLTSQAIAQKIQDQLQVQRHIDSITIRSTID